MVTLVTLVTLVTKQTDSRRVAALCAARDYDGLLTVARSIAHERRLRHAPACSADELMEEWAGVVGEIEFAKTFALDPLPVVGRHGAGPVDFVLPGSLTVDVKTAWWHAVKGRPDQGRLMVEAGKVDADAYVFAEAHRIAPDLADARLVGWAWDYEVAGKRALVEGKYLHQSHRLPRAALRPVDALRAQSAFVAAQALDDEVALMSALVETQTSFDGRTVVYRWWHDRTSVSVEIDGRRVGLVYRAVRADRALWFDLFDPSKTAHATPRKALGAAMARVTGRAVPPKPPRETTKQKAAASQWRQEHARRE